MKQDASWWDRKVIVIRGVKAFWRGGTGWQSFHSKCPNIKESKQTTYGTTAWRIRCGIIFSQGETNSWKPTRRINSSTLLNIDLWWKTGHCGKGPRAFWVYNSRVSSTYCKQSVHMLPFLYKHQLCQMTYKSNHPSEAVFVSFFRKKLRIFVDLERSTHLEKPFYPPSCSPLL